MPQTELELIAARDHDARARFYDRHAAIVGRFCAAVCQAAEVGEPAASVAGAVRRFASSRGDGESGPPERGN